MSASEEVSDRLGGLLPRDTLGTPLSGLGAEIARTGSGPAARAGCSRRRWAQ